MGNSAVVRRDGRLDMWFGKQCFRDHMGKSQKFAEKMTFNGKPGVLPSIDVLKNIGAIRKKQNLRQRLKFLEENEIEADGYWGCIWCSEEYCPYGAYCFSLDFGINGWGIKGYTRSNNRVALNFFFMAYLDNAVLTLRSPEEIRREDGYSFG